MRKIFLEDLPSNKNGTIRWRDSVGCSVRFEYDGITGIIDIVGYDNTKYHIIAKYKDRERSIFVGSFKECMIQELIGLRHREYMYDVGDVIHEQYLVLEKTKIKHAKNRDPNAKSRSGMNKAYVVKCLKCGYVFTIGEDIINDGKQKSYCKACGENSTIAVKGYNDLWTTNPEIAKMLLNKDEGYTHLKTSNKKTDWVCPDCNNIIKSRSFAQVYFQGLACKNCGDGVSYPEKIMRECLKQSGVNFNMHVVFDWSNNKEYDFYLPDYNIIVETHGVQHYEESFKRIGGRTLKDEQDNDKYKIDLALKNKIKEYVEIDCRLSDFEYIYANIKSSALNRIIDFSSIDEDKIAKGSLSNYLIKVCNMWNYGVTDVAYIANEMSLSEHTIRTYLKKCQKLGLCEYSKTCRNLRTRAVRCKTTNETFDAIADACKKYDIHACAVRKSCLHPEYSAGKLPDKTKLYWEYI